MDAGSYLDHLRADADRLCHAARKAGLDARVPTCPEWDVAALVTHVAAVYAHKVACMRLQRRPAEGEWATEPPAGQDPVDWLSATLVELSGELEARGPEAPSFTWHPADQTVGFWHRRMAQETVVHRVDAELAAGYTSPVDDELASDGVDEMLAVFLAGPWWKEQPVDTATGRTVAVRTAGNTWRVTLEADAVAVSREEGPADGTVDGQPFDVLMWVWGREPATVTVAGDAVAELRERLALVSD
jgi:uncharacterized protein (TIGR03083 family)